MSALNVVRVSITIAIASTVGILRGKGEYLDCRGTWIREFETPSGANSILGHLVL
jgi:hypothetical protein